MRLQAGWEAVRVTGVPEPVLVALQEGLPLLPRPFAEAARPLGLSEAELLAHAIRLFESGKARRLGGIFDSRRMGFVTALCAARVEFPKAEGPIGELVGDPHITHCYERGDLADVADVQGKADWEALPNLWFTYGAEPADFAAGVERAGRLLAPKDVFVLPALRHFRIQVVLGRKDVPPPPPAAIGQLPPLTEAERRVVRLLQGHVPPCPEPFAAVAREAGVSQDGLLAILRGLQACGRLKRVGLVLRHRSAGYAANAMCAWHVPAADIETVGRRLAECPAVTHCYERPPSPATPFNLYAMMHARTWPEWRTEYGRTVGPLGLDGGILLCSIREFKKTSPVYV